MTRGFGLSPRAMVTIALVAGLLAALVFALFLAYYSELDASNAFAYQSAVVSAQRDSELLEAKQFDQKLQPSWRATKNFSISTSVASTIRLIHRKRPSRTFTTPPLVATTSA